MRRMLPWLLLLLLALPACRGRTAGEALGDFGDNWTETARGLVAAPDRTEADRRLDPGRHPAELLAFFGVRPGMRVAELGAGGGYRSEEHTSELQSQSNLVCRLLLEKKK